MPTARGRRPQACVEPLIKVTLERLEGISFNSVETCREEKLIADQDVYLNGSRRSAPSSQVPNVTATVSFTGSVPDMQVVSSSLCPKTGNLLVESAQATHDSSTKLESGTVPLVVRWDSCEDRVGSPSESHSNKPHLTIRLPSRDPNLPSISLEQMNRDCNVVCSSIEAPPLEGSDLSSDSGGDGKHSRPRSFGSFDDHSEGRGASVIWSASGAGMPEIVELNVSLVIGKDEAHMSVDEPHMLGSPGSSQSSFSTQNTPQEGVAYLVFFGHDRVSTTMDLPVKRYPSQKPTGCKDKDLVVLEDYAMLRIRVDVLPEGKEDDGAAYRRSLLDSFAGRKKLEPILQRLRQESDQQQIVEDRQPQQPLPEQLPKSVEEQTTNLGFCAGDTSLMAIWRELREVVKHCDDGGVYVQSSDSAASTLDTAASLGI